MRGHGCPRNEILAVQNDGVGIFGRPQGEPGGTIEHDEGFVERVGQMHRTGVDGDDGGTGIQLRDPL